MLEWINEILAKKMQRKSKSQPESNNKPVGRTASRTCGGSEDRTFRSTERVRLCSMWPTVLPAGGEADVFDLGEGRDVEGCVVLEGSMLPCVAQVVTGVREVGGIRRLSFVV